MTANPLLGVFFHRLGGLASASFYVPYKRVRRWSWEIFWIVGGVFSWIIAPWIFAALRTEHLLDVLAATQRHTLLWCWFWGSQMGVDAFSSWTLHMASIIIFATVWGFVLKEWAGSRFGTKRMVWSGVLVLVIATIVIGAGNYLNAR